MDNFKKDIENIHPSQLYINREKLERIKKIIDSEGIESVQPLPIKKIGNKIFFTDSHTTAYEFKRRGIKKIKVYWDEDNLDWYSYLVCINWCRKNKIFSISDLKNSIIADNKYKKLWLNRCEKLQNSVKENKNQYQNIKMIKNKERKGYICNIILRSLPKWFGIENAIKEYVDSVKDKPFWIASIAILLLASCR